VSLIPSSSFELPADDGLDQLLIFRPEATLHGHDLHPAGRALATGLVRPAVAPLEKEEPVGDAGRVEGQVQVLHLSVIEIP